MELTLISGDNILINKWVMGERIFNIWDASEKKYVEIIPIPWFGEGEAQ